MSMEIPLLEFISKALNLERNKINGQSCKWAVYTFHPVQWKELLKINLQHFHC